MIKYKKRKMKFLVWLLVLAAAVIFIAYSTVKIKKLEGEVDRLSDPVAVYEEASKQVDISVINAEIQDIGELATVEYLYTDAAKFEDPKKLFGKELPFEFTTKSFVVKWDGVIKAGVDITQVTEEADDTEKKIVVKLPKAKILSNDIDDDSVEVLDEKDGLFNSIKVEDVKSFDAVSKDDMEQRAIDQGILEKASQNAKEMIEHLIQNDVTEESGYTVEFEEAE
ncbi:DUF4230 domain-containing protein [Roseburia sp. 831b]|uniref:DUF4230 domain-containing protein n=1 Tax=Roseburia sp. 831b TaxID=1261635 RepID=UPI000950DB82|nr:DUF4230 domain-containing protein [Roseburia sp. 831b]WVK72081.1 DUF4230 domain-containing protein [Roseburia sp. 831b]